MLYNKILESIYYLAGKTTKYDAWIKYQALMKNQWLPREELKKLQWQKLKAILTYSYENIPFYKNKFDSASLIPYDINNPKDLLHIPITTKEELLKETHPLNPKLSANNLEWVKTSGTTGTPLNWPFNIASYNTKYALLLRDYSFTDWKLGNKTASLWWPGHSSYNGESFTEIKKLVYFFAHRRKLFSPITKDSTGINEPLTNTIYNNLKCSPPSVFETSPENLLFLCYFMEDNALQPLKIKTVVVSGIITENMRNKFQKWFQGEIFNTYGPHEMEGIANDCSHHQGLHLSSDSYYLECLNENEPCLPNETGKFILTDLDNYTQPFIRYEIGDCGSYSEKQCPCGRGLPLINYIEGRSKDFIINQNSQKISPRTIIKFFGNYPEIKFFQLIQKDLLKFQLFLIKKNEVYLNIEMIKTDLKNILGNSADIETLFTQAIPAEPSGKFRWVKNNVGAIHESPLQNRTAI
ncbi:MAG: hypothetical protein PHX78_08830 [bacterium]|nr:hypothetical protein [bacterium]